MVKVCQIPIFNYNEKKPTPEPGVVFQFFVIMKPRSGWVSKTVFVYGSKEGIFLELGTNKRLDDVLGEDYQITHWGPTLEAPVDHYLMFNKEANDTH